MKMGGKAFAHLLPPLRTPRMPTTAYLPLRAKCLSILSTLYKQVASPADEPEKTSYGDIDILVADPFDQQHPPTRESIATTLSATQSLPSGPLISFAVPYPDRPGDFVQVDVQRCTAAIFPWHVFHESYGDLWNILGTSIRRFGLTANDKGLHVRVAEIETDQRKKSLLFLTCEPDDVLRFLRLDVQAYRNGWERVDDMFSFLARGRFMRREAYMRQDLKANDRKRVAMRNCYRRFVEEWVPRWDADGEQGKGEAREAVLEEALDLFGKRAEYEEKVAAWRAQQKELARGLEGREERKARALADAVYADAWIKFLELSLYNVAAA